MRHGRAKQARKTLQFFQRTVGLKTPYHVLLDGTFVVAFVQHSLPLQERLQGLLQVTSAAQTLVLVTTESVLQELHTLAEKTVDDQEKKSIFQQAHAWMAQHCSVKIEDIPTVSLDWASTSRTRQGNNNTHDYLADLSAAGRDFLSLLTEANGIDNIQVDASSSAAAAASLRASTTPPLLVASQDEALLHLCRQSARVPVIRLARGSVLLLEQPSQAAQAAQQATERVKWTVRGSVPEQEQVLVDLVKQKERRERQRTTVLPQHVPRQRAKRKAKGPNPLSCKKKKDAAATTTTTPKSFKRPRT